MLRLIPFALLSFGRTKFHLLRVPVWHGDVYEPNQRVVWEFVCWRIFNLSSDSSKYGTSFPTPILVGCLVKGQCVWQERVLANTRLNPLSYSEKHASAKANAE